MAFRAGWHVYVGSALGSGGLKRLDRHVSLARERNKRPKWHVDYLLTDPAVFPSYTYVCSDNRTPRMQPRRYISVNRGFRGFGCSDCSCTTHLFFRDRDPRKEIVAAFRDLELVPVVKSIISRDE